MHIYATGPKTIPQHCDSPRNVWHGMTLFCSPGVAWGPVCQQTTGAAIGVSFFPKILKHRYPDSQNI